MLFHSTDSPTSNTQEENAEPSYQDGVCKKAMLQLEPLSIVHKGVQQVSHTVYIEHYIFKERHTLLC